MFFWEDSYITYKQFIASWCIHYKHHFTLYEIFMSYRNEIKYTHCSLRDVFNTFSYDIASREKINGHL